MTARLNRIKLWSVGGGKGGIGKSLFTLGLGVCLAQLQKKVILLDADLGGANLHTLMGVRYPKVTLEDFLLKRLARLEDTIIETQLPGIGIICGADDILGSANPTYAQKIRLLKQIEELPADFVLLDLGAGTSFNFLDFFNYSPGKIIIFTSQATSLQNAYGFIKSALYRKLSRDLAKEEELLWLLYQLGGKDPETEITSLPDLRNRLKEADPERHARLSQLLWDFQVFLVVNMAKTHQDLKSPEIIQTVCADFLGIQPQVLGEVPYDSGVEAAVNQMTPFPLYQKKGRATQALQQIALRVLKQARLPKSPWVEDNPAAGSGKLSVVS